MLQIPDKSLCSTYCISWVLFYNSFLGLRKLMKCVSWINIWWNYKWIKQSCFLDYALTNIGLIINESLITSCLVGVAYPQPRLYSVHQWKIPEMGEELRLKWSIPRLLLLLLNNLCFLKTPRFIYVIWRRKRKRKRWNWWKRLRRTWNGKNVTNCSRIGPSKCLCMCLCNVHICQPAS